MGYVYILKSEKNQKFYIGSTANLERRMSEHNSGQTKSLKNILPVKLVFSKKYDTASEARKMEKHLKKLKSRSILERIVLEQTIKTGP